MWHNYYPITESDALDRIRNGDSTALPHHAVSLESPETDRATARPSPSTTSTPNFFTYVKMLWEMKPKASHQRNLLLACCGAVTVLGLLVAFLPGGPRVLGESSTKPSLVVTSMYRDTRVKHSKPAPELEKLEHEKKWSFGDSVEHGSDAVTSISQMSQDALDVEPISLLQSDKETLWNQRNTNKTGQGIYFSELSLREDGYDIQEIDDQRCEVASNKRFNPTDCLGAPYIYISFHGGGSHKRVRNVCKFSRDGCSMGSLLVPSTIYRPRSLRGLLLHENFLFVAEAWRKDSRILKYSHCNPALDHRRELLQILVTGSESSPESGLIHPYGFAKRADDPYIYVSIQETGSVMRFHHATGEPADLSIASKRRVEEEGEDASSYTNGTFIRLDSGEEIRGIAFDQQGILYVANKQRGVLAYDKSGNFVGIIPQEISKPISIYYCRDRGSLWIGSAKSHTLYEIDASTWEVMQTISHKHLVHPAGFTTFGDDLFVLSQDKDKLLRFSMSSGELMEIVLENVQDVGERLILSPC